MTLHFGTFKRGLDEGTVDARGPEALIVTN